MTLSYPQWIPGEHAPNGPIADLAGLRFTAAGRTLPWARDPVDMYAFHIEVPMAARSIEVALDFLMPPTSQGFSSAASSTDRLALLSWNQVVLYPKGRAADDLLYAAHVRLPEGWSFGTALPVARESAGEIDFTPVSLTTLVDSPVLAGLHFRTVDLAPGASAPVLMHLAADGPAALEIPPDLAAAYARLASEANALFGARHYRGYHFLVTLSDHTAHFGLEHHESSDDRTYERALIDPNRRMLMAGLLPHEMVHSWNGKYRRPADLATPDFQKPMQTDLLWVYEGLTTYLGNVLTARSGLRTPEEAREELAESAAMLEHHAGRTWRPLLDTAVAAQRLYDSRHDWQNWRRRVDFYAEGALIWLEADVTIRRATGGRRSLDDFCRAFFGGETGPPAVATYTLDDIVRALGRIAPEDWEGFFRRRLTMTSQAPPSGGLSGAGWRLVYSPVRSKLLDAAEEVRKMTDASSSIGLELEEDGTITDVVPGLPAEKAGLAPGMKLVAVGGRRWSRKVLFEALAATPRQTGPLELLVENAEYFKTYRLDYHGGERYPHLERDPAVPDLLSSIHSPITAKPSGAGTGP